jgi:hypothetical protein
MDAKKLKQNINNLINNNTPLALENYKYMYNNPNIYKKIRTECTNHVHIIKELDVCIFNEFYVKNDDGDSYNSKYDDEIQKYTYDCELQTYVLNKYYENNAILMHCIDNDYMNWLQVLHEHGIQLDIDILNYATEFNKLHVLKFYHESGLDWSSGYDDKITATACQQGYYECLVYAYANGCPMYMNCCYLSASHGHLECYKYAEKYGEQHKDVYALYFAIYKGHLNCVEYILSNELFDKNNDKLCDYAISGMKSSECKNYKKQYECFEYLVLIGCPYTSEQVESVKNHKSTRK